MTLRELADAIHLVPDTAAGYQSCMLPLRSMVQTPPASQTPTLDNLRQQCSGIRSPEYIAKQLHDVPSAPVVDRIALILLRCKDKRVLDIGASGVLHDGIVTVASKVYGIDRPAPGVSAILQPQEVSPGVVGMDLDDVALSLPRYEVDIIVCGEVLEHLSNPGWFLTRLRDAYLSVPVIVSVPNAFSDIGRRWLEKGKENVNLDHVAWYSWRTLETLLGRVGYTVRERYSYNGRERFAEGLIAVVD